MKENEITAEEVKRALRKVRRIDARIKILEESQEKAYARITSATQKLSKTGVRGGQTKDAMAEYVSLSEEIVKELTRLNQIKRDMMKLISKVRKHDLQSVLQLYYIDGYTWEEVAVKMHFSWRWVMKLHGNALQEITRVAQRNPALYSAIKGK